MNDILFIRAGKSECHLRVRGSVRRPMLSLFLGAGALAASPFAAQAQNRSQASQPPPKSTAAEPASPAELLKVPLVNLHIGGIERAPNIKNPNAGNPQAAEHGMGLYVAMNCVVCHGPNGGGAMGPSLDTPKFKFGSNPAQIFLSIEHGLPLGMPHWGPLLPDDSIWDLITYIKSIDKAPSSEWGTTISVEAYKKSKEQVPAEFVNSVNPWAHTEPFSFGQEPAVQKKTSSSGG